MNQPNEQRIAEIEQGLGNLETLVEDWQDWKFITRGASHKIGVAEGLASTLQHDVIQMKVDLAHVARQIDVVLDQQIEADKRFDEVNKKLDLILQFLQPGRE